MSLITFSQFDSIENMVLIPQGEFMMGKNSPGPSDWQPGVNSELGGFCSWF
jgi:formylglycine-generating enzyme required for sulfatase activity